MQTLCWKPLTFWDEEQISVIQREEEKIKEYDNLSIYELKDKIRELDLEIWNLELDIHYHEEEIINLEEEIRNLELEKDEKEEELQNIEKALKLRE